MRTHGSFLNLNPGAITRKKWRRNLLRPEIREIQGIPKLEAENGHIIFICLKQLCLTWRKSSRSNDKFTAEVQRMTWLTSTWTPVWRIYSWTSRSKPQFILVETFWRIYDAPRINSWSLWTLIPSDWKVDHGSERNNGLTTIDYKEPTWRSTTLLCDKACEITRMPKPTSSSTRCSVSEAWEMNDWSLEEQN